MVEKLLNDYNLCLLNTGEPTCRHHSHHSFSVPDISICDSSLELELDWLTHNDLCGSDHFPVILKTSVRDDEPAAEHWKFDRADWMSFCTLCVSWLSDELALSEDPVAQPRSGELRTQKLNSYLVRTQSLNVLPLKPGVGQYITIHATLTARDFFLSCLFLHFWSIHLHFFQNRTRFFPVLAVANTWFLCRPTE